MNLKIINYIFKREQEIEAEKLSVSIRNIIHGSIATDSLYSTTATINNWGGPIMYKDVEWVKFMEDYVEAKRAIGMNPFLTNSDQVSLTILKQQFKTYEWGIRIVGIV